MLEINNKYKINEAGVFGTGTWAVVKECFPMENYTPPPYRANKTILQPTSSLAATKPPRLVAKIIDKQKLKEIVKNEENGQAIVQRELNILETLPSHPGVVRFVEYIENDTHYYLIFEAAIHGDLCELLLKSPTQRVEEPTAQKYVVELIHGLLHCHRHNVVHRDIKPENILVAEGNVLKIADFGLAKTSNGGPAMNVMTGVVGSACSSNNLTGASNHVNNKNSNEPFESKDDINSNNNTGSSISTFNATEAAAANTSSATSNNILHFLYPNRIFPKGSSLQTVQIEHRLRKATGKGPNALPSSASLASSLDVPIVPSMLPPSPSCQGHEIMGTFRYGAPEMFEAKFANTSFDAFHADSWSLGVVTFITLTGTFPFSAGSNADERQTWKVLRESTLALPVPRENGGEVSSEACDFLAKLLDKDPQKRLKLWDALDHPWLSAEVRRQQTLARDSVVVPAKVKSIASLSESEIVSGSNSNPHVVSIFTDFASPQFVTACQQMYPLSPALEHMRKMVLANTSDDNLKNLYNQLVHDHYQKFDALGRLRQAVSFGLPEMVRAQQLLTSSSHRQGSIAGASDYDDNSSHANNSANRGVVSGSTRTGGGVRASTPSRNNYPATGGGSSARNTNITPRTPQSNAMRGISPLRSGLPGASQQQSPQTNVSNNNRMSTPTTRTTRASPSSTALRGSSQTQNNNTTAGTTTTTTRAHASPISRFGAGANRRATPTPGTRGATPSSTGVRGGGATPTSTSTAAARRSSPLPSSRGNITGRTTTPSRTTTTTGVTTPASTAAAAPNVSVGDAVAYKNSKAVVRFSGATKFAPGLWLGLELVDGDGLHDGTSSIDKKRYFQCPAGKGVFVRPSQIAKLDE